MKKIVLLFSLFATVGLTWGQTDCNDNSACNYDASATGSSECTYATTWYIDIDGDGYGVSSEYDQVACEAPSGLYVSNSSDGCPTDANKSAAGTCGCGTSDADSDGDGVVDCNDLCPYDANKTAPGTCGCGITDLDSDGDGTPDCSDGCPHDASKIAAGSCGCGELDADSDGDGIADCDDICPGSSSQVDANGNGIGDDCEVLGCTFPAACNYDSDANVYDGSCVFANESKCEVCEGNATNGTGTVSDSSSPGSPCSCAGGVTLYIDAIGICGGDCTEDVDGNGVCDDDECVAGIDECGICGGSGIPIGDCDCDGNQLDECGVCGGTGALDGYNCDGTCVDDADGDGVCDQFEITGCLDATACNYNAEATESGECFEIDDCGVCGGTSVFTTSDGSPCSPGDSDCLGANGECDCDGTLPAAGKDCDGNCLTDDDGDLICDEFEVDGCTDATACNYNSAATDDDGSCAYKDALDMCGGSCSADDDADGICDDVDACIGVENECGECNGVALNFTDADGAPCAPGTPGCTNDEGHCDCMGNDFDALNVCGGTCLQDLDGDGICDLDEDGNVADTNICSEELKDAVGVCNGTCTEDADGDGLCDHDTDGDGIAEDPCPSSTNNFVDECGVCGGSGIPAGYCDCDGRTYDVNGECGGDCDSDSDGDGICDGVDTCDGTLDVCGVCNGPGIPAGDCDCFGNTADAVGNCGGNCTQDSDGDGICDVDANGNILDTCDGTLDACGVCNGTGPVEGCGCEPAYAGECDCNGSVMDECGVCGGSGAEFARDCDGNCINDSDGDGVCDEEEVMLLSDGLLTEYEVADKTTSVLNPISVQRSQDSLRNLLSYMTENLDDGSLTGYSKNVTIEQQIIDNGTLLVEGLSTFNQSAHVKGYLTIDGDLNITGNATIEGTTFSNGGAQTAAVDMKGDAEISGNATVHEVLIVEGESNLKNTVDVSGDLNIYQGNQASGLMRETKVFSVSAANGNTEAAGDFTLSGDADVDGFGRLNGLNVDGLSRLDRTTADENLILNSTFDVLGDFNMNDNFRVVASSGNTAVGGDMHVEGNMTVNGDLEVDGTATIEGTTFSEDGLETTSVTMSGDLHVEGKADVGMNLTVYGNATYHHTLSGGGDFTVYDGATDGVFSDTESFTVASSTGNTVVAGQLNVDGMSSSGNWYQSGNTDINSTLAVTGSVQLDGLGAGSTTLNTATVSADVDANGNFDVDGVFDGGGNLVAGGIESSSYASLKSTTISGPANSLGVVLHATSAGERVALFKNTSATSVSDQKGIKIVLNKELPTTQNDYVQFMNSEDVVLGRIEGFHRDELGDHSDHALNLDTYNIEITDANNGIRSAKMGTIQAGFDVASAVVNLIGAKTRTSSCFGIVFYWIFPAPFVCQTAPAAGPITAAIVNVVTTGVSLATAISGNVKASEALDVARDAKQSYITAMETQFRTVSGERVGVTYESGSGDYAEWLERMNPSDDFIAGEIVGVHGGKISHSTQDADALFVISTKPIVLGNMPSDEEWKFERAAFMGQVPVFVRGKVKAGDYIVASGNHDGFGKAIAPEMMTAHDLLHVVGRAWQDGEDRRVNLVNVQVGPGTGIDEVAGSLFERVDAIDEQNASLKEAIMSWAQGEVSGMEAASEAGMMPSQLTLDVEEIAWNDPAVEDITVFEFTPLAMELAIERSLKMLRETHDMDASNNPTLKMLRESEDFRESFIKTLTLKVNDHNEWAAECQRKYEDDLLRPITKKTIQVTREEVEAVKSQNTRLEKRRAFWNKVTKKASGAGE